MSDQQFRPAHSAFDESPEVKEAARLLNISGSEKL